MTARFNMYYQIHIERDIKIHVKSTQTLKQMLELITCKTVIYYTSEAFQC